MSSPPTQFDRQTSFAAYTAENPGEPHSGSSLDAEFNAVKTALDETQDRLAEVQDDDGVLKRGSVGRAQLDSSITIGFSAPEPWATATLYDADVSTVFKDAVFYICVEDHTSGTFATDLAAGKWEEIADLSVAAALEDGAVSTDKLADLAVTAAKIGALAVTTAKIATGAVTTAKISDSNVTAAKLAADAVETAKILDANVTAAKLATDSVTTAKIVAANVTAAKLATDSVETAKIKDANVTTAKLAAEAVDHTKLAIGVLVGRAYYEYTTAAALTGNTPFDSTIPQVTEGNSIFDVEYTPKTATNRLRVTFFANYSTSVVANTAFHLHLNDANDAAAVWSSVVGSANNIHSLSGSYEWVPGVTTAVAINLRAGAPAANLYVNQAVAGTTLGAGKLRWTLLIEEFKE